MPEGKRLCDLARELNMPSSVVLHVLHELGYDVRGPSSVVPEKAVEECKKRIEEERERIMKVMRKRDIVRKRMGLKPQKKKPFVPREKKKFERAKMRVEKTYAKMQASRIERKYKKPKREIIEEEEKRVIRLGETVSVKELAELIGKDPLDLIAECLKLGKQVTINQRLPFEDAEMILHEFGYEAELIPYWEEEKEEEKEAEEKLYPRPPVVTVMGHVDHGKTSLLDYIRKTQVAAKEKGGITQHIGAYTVEYEGKKITFIDTPGHEAFTAMRARGAQVTDIVVLVVAANEGVKAQTVEAINHTRDAGVPMVVAINKIDLDSADPDRVKRELANYNVLVEDYGGNVIAVHTSAKTGEGIEDLLHAILVVAEELDLKAPKDGPARGTIIETKIEKGKGKVATVIIEKGTLKKGDWFVAGAVYGKVRMIYDEWGRELESVGPGEPGQIVGFEDLPFVGDKLRVCESEDEAKELARKRREALQVETRRSMVSLEEFHRRLTAGEAEELKVIVKGDTAGSVEALCDSLEKVQVENVKVKIVHRGVGSVTESDVLLGKASNAVIIGYHVKPELRAKELAKVEGVEIRTYDIIYHALEDIKKVLAGLLPPVYEEQELGKAEVRKVFKIKNVGWIAGCYVLSGKVVRNAKARVRRDGEVVFDGEIASLKRFKEDVKEVLEGYECGIGLSDNFKIKEGDIIEVYEIVEKKREIAI